MLTLLLGPDDFSKTEYINALALKDRAEIENIYPDDQLPRVEHFAEQNLFSLPKVFVLHGLIGKFDWDAHIATILKSPNNIVLVEEKLDKRLTSTKQLLANKSITQKEFILPHGRELDSWIIDRVKYHGGSISREAADSLSKRLGRDEAQETKFGGKIVDIKEIYTLWQAENEILKLIAFCGKGNISSEAIGALVAQNSETDVLSIVNAIGEGKKQTALELMSGFLQSEASSDEKAKIIHLNALLSEQFRNVALVQNFGSASESEILQDTGWKSGRLFVIKKIASHFNPKKVLELLNRLEALDEELKSGSTPPRVLLDLIMVQLMA